MKENILVVRVGRLGDMIMITAALRALLDKFPDARVDILTSADGNRVLRDYDPRIGQLIHYDRRHLIPFWHRRQLTQQIQAANYDYIYCFETNPSFAALWTHTSAKTYSLHRDPNIIQNYAQDCLELVLPKPATTNSYWINLTVTESGREQLQAVLKQAGIPSAAILVGLHPSFSGLAKNPLRRGKHAKHKIWPAQHWADLAHQLIQYGEQMGRPIVPIIDLLPEEARLGQTINRLCGQRILILTEPPNFARYQAYLERLDLLVSPDTGPMHLAAALNTPVVALFSGKDPRDCGPFAPPENYRILRAEDGENPGAGLAGITPEVVMQGCLGYLH